MAGLTEKNKRAIDLYLSADEEFQGNGTRCWQKIYGTKSEDTAATNWWRMLRKAEAQVYLESRQKEIEAKRAEIIAYEQADALQDILAVRDDAMKQVNVGKVVRKVKEVDPETGELVEKVEYAPVETMVSHTDALRAANDALRVQGKHPDQKLGAGGMQVQININTSHPGHEARDVTGEGDEPPPITAGELPPVVVIGKQ